MATEERGRLEEVLQLAHEIARQLATLRTNAGEADALALRLAQAHALGLVDQLAEMVKVAHTLPAAAAAGAELVPEKDIMH